LEIKCVIESIHLFHKSKIRYAWMFNILEIRGRCLELKYKYKLEITRMCDKLNMTTSLV